MYAFVGSGVSGDNKMKWRVGTRTLPSRGNRGRPLTGLRCHEANLFTYAPVTGPSTLKNSFNATRFHIFACQYNTSINPEHEN